MIVTIDSLDNGFLLTIGYTTPVRESCATLDQAMQRLLFAFEGRSEHFGGDLYGKVKVHRSSETTRDTHE